MRTSIVLLMAVVGTCVLLSCSGCYHHVVSAEGIGSERVDTESPNEKEESRPLEVTKPRE
jgi:hypothetical protein